MLFFRKQDLHSEEDVQDAEHHRNALRDDRCHSRPLHPHAHSCNEQEIQHHIQARGDEHTSGITLLPMARSRPAQRL